MCPFALKWDTFGQYPPIISDHPFPLPSAAQILAAPENRPDLEQMTRKGILWTFMEISRIPEQFLSVSIASAYLSCKTFIPFDGKDVNSV